MREYEETGENGIEKEGARGSGNLYSKTYKREGRRAEDMNIQLIQSTMNSKIILLCLIAALFCSQATAQYYAGAYSPYYGYPAYGYAGYGWGYPGYAAWWGSNKGGKGPEGPAPIGPNGPSGLTGNQ